LWYSEIIYPGIYRHKLYPSRCGKKNADGMKLNKMRMNGENKIIIERSLLKILSVDFMNTNDYDFLNT